VPVIDASVVFEYLVAGPRATGAAEHIHDLREQAWAPHLLDAEVGSAVRGHVRSGKLRISAAYAALEEFAALPVERMTHPQLLARAFELRENLTFYGALYVALAEELDMTLVTLDSRLARAPGIRATVELLA
jgi:predicted nucleic acid-binding protein